ncbi:MAG: mercuric reductase [Polyangiaceae bacterium]|jgi:pyruvate/2-oxoglutarate dehydrogenase complex dihydrolipoamide dehydrogenase (E3) component
MSDTTADVLVIGSGQAGVPLAARLAARGKSVVLFERGPLGGTCVNRGCTPTKTMVASARAAHVARTAGRLGVEIRDVRVDLAAVVERKDAIVRRWQRGVEKRLGSAGDRLRLVRAAARFTGPRTLEAGDARFRGDIVVIDTGARPAVPDIPGLSSVPFLDSTTILNVRQLPEHLVILGGGYIGCELGQMFRRFGSAVTILARGGHLLGREDADVSAALEDVMRSEGIALELTASIESVRSDGEGGVVLKLGGGGKELAGTHLLVAVGRRPNTDELGCDAAGVTLDARGFVTTDDGYATSAPGVYAVGDVTGGPQFTHTSWDDHRILFERLMDNTARGKADRLVPFTVFTDPQVAGVGLSEKEARARGVAYELATMPFGDIARAIEVDETAGLMKVLLDPATERVLGARIVGAEAGELVHPFVVLMEAKASLRAIVDAEFAHPTFAEGVQTLVMRLERYKLR